MSGPCRFEPSLPCTGAFTLSISDCNDACRGPVDLSPGKTDHEAKRHGQAGQASRADRQTKPAAAVEPREEEKTMAQEVKGTATVGICDRCDRPADKREGAKGQHGQFCQSCAVMVRKCGREGRPVPPFGSSGKRPVKPQEAQQSPAKAPSAPKASPPPVIAKPRPQQAPSAPPVMPPTHGLALRFEVRIRPGMTPLEIMELMRALPSDAVVA